MEEFTTSQEQLFLKPSIGIVFIALLLSGVQRRKSKPLLNDCLFLQRISFSELPLLVISMLNLLFVTK